MLIFIATATVLLAPVLCGPNPSIKDSLPSNNNDEPPDIENHPNLGLLPTKRCGDYLENKLLGGNQTLLFEQPWMVLLSYTTDRGNKLSCVGTLINERYVLTAAHCVTFIRDRKLNGAIIGEHDVRTDPDCENEQYEGGAICADNIKNVTIEEVLPHPGYNPSKRSFSDDIALIRLSQAINNSDSVGSICLPVTSELQREPLEESRGGDIAGWMIKRDKVQSPVLSKLPVTIIRNEDCQVAYKRYKLPPVILKSHVCATNTFSYGGDPGGPLMYRGHVGGAGIKQVQRGIVSFGPSNSGSLPEVYTRVSHYMKWILDNIRA